MLRAPIPQLHLGADIAFHTDNPVVAELAVVTELDAAQSSLGGPVLALVNNAGVRADGLALSLSDEDWRIVLDTNLGSTYRLTRAALRAMAANPADLEEGKAAQDSWGNGAVAAITRLRTDTVKALPDSSLVTIGGSAGSGGQGSNGGGTQAGGGAASQ